MNYVRIEVKTDALQDPRIEAATKRLIRLLGEWRRPVDPRGTTTGKDTPPETPKEQV